VLCVVLVYVSTANSALLTLPKSTLTVPSMLIPYSSQLFSVCATFAALISALLGTQPTFKQSPAAFDDVSYVSHIAAYAICVSV
jgi:hypothetical protein